MSKVIIIKRENNQISIIYPNELTHGNGEGLIPYAECAGLQRFINPDDPDYMGTVYDYEIIDKKDLPSREGLDSGAQFYWDDSTSSVKIDTDWQKRLMPTRVIRFKERDYCQTELDTELAKETPDPLKCIKLKNKIDKLKLNKFSELEIYQMALNNIIKRSKVDKSYIETILSAKITELGG